MSDDSIPMFWPDIGPRPHPYAAVFRMLVGEEKESLAANVADKGLQEKVKMFEEMILDGRNRYLVLVDEGVFDPEIETWRERPDLFEEFSGTREQALDYVWSLNAERRHDTPSQRAIAAERYANLRNITQAEAAAKFGVSERQVNSAAKVLEQAEPELVQAVEEGRLPLYLAEQAADLDEDDQREIAVLPKREASAVARQKLQDPPPLTESGPVVKAMEPSKFVLFAEAVLKVCGMGHPLSAATVDGLAREHSLLADADGTFNFSREAVLAVELARKKLNIAEGGFAGMSSVIIGSAGLPDDLDGLAQAYRNAIVLYDRAIRAGDTVGEAQYGVAMEAVLFRANGNSQFGIATNERPREVLAAARAPDGTVPMWGQQGCFIVESETWQRHEPVRAIVVLGQYNGIYAVDPGKPFPSETGYMTVSWGRFGDRDVAKYGKSLIAAAIRGFHNSMGNAIKPLPVPSTVYRFSEGGSTGPVAVSLEGGELDRTAYHAAIAALTEPKGKLHQSTAADVLRAGVAAGVSRAQMAEDLGHPIGTIQNWTHKLKLTGLGTGQSAPRPREGAPS